MATLQRQQIGKESTGKGREQRDRAVIWLAALDTNQSGIYAVFSNRSVLQCHPIENTRNQDTFFADSEVRLESPPQLSEINLDSLQ